MSVRTTARLHHQGPVGGGLIFQSLDFEKRLSTHREPVLMNRYPNIPVSQFQQTQHPDISILQIDIPISQFQLPISTHY